ncbi:MAG: putative Ig domain-containing protein [Pseudomonadota bacterium]
MNEKKTATAAVKASTMSRAGTIGMFVLALVLAGCGGGGGGGGNPAPPPPPTNSAPTISGTPPAMVDQDAQYAFSFTANDADGDTLSFTIDGAPAWLMLDAATGDLSGQPGNADVGVSADVTVSVSDGELSATSAPFSVEVVNVNDAPVFTSAALPTMATEDDPFTFQLTAIDADADALTFGLRNAPIWLLVDPMTGALSGTPTNADVGVTTDVIVTVSDGTATTSSAGVTLEVVNVNDAPELVGALPATATEDAAFAFQFNATDADGDTVTFSIANAPAWATLDPATGELSGAPTNDDVGITAGIVVSVSDGVDTTSSAPFTLEVLNTNDAPQITGVAPTTVDEGATYAFTPSASDVDVSDNLTFSIANTPSWASFDPDTGALTGTPSNTDQGEYADVTISVGDGMSTASLDPFTITVVDITTVMISGVVTDAPVADAAIFGSFDGDDFEATADGSGNYTITLQRREGEFDADALVTLRAFGMAAGQEQVELVSVLGSLAQLVEAAGADETLGASEFPRLNVTHVSTARDLLLPDFNGGAAATDAETLARAETAIPLQLLLDTAALIKAIADDGLIAVPDGETVLGLLLPDGMESRQEAIAALLEAQGLQDADGVRTDAFAQALADAQADTLADGNVVAGFDAATLAGTRVWADESAPDHLLRDIAVKSVVDLADGGTGTFYRQRYEALGARAQKVRTDAISLTWALMDQTLSLTFGEADALAVATTTDVVLADRNDLVSEFGFDQEVVDFITQALVDGDPVPDPLPVRTRLASRTAQAVSSVDGDVQAIVEESEVSDLDQVLTDLEWPGDLPSGTRASELTRVISPATAREGDLADDVVSLQAWAVPVRYDLGGSFDTAPGIAVDLFTLRQDGRTTVGPLSDLDFAWNLVDGALVLTSEDEEGTTERFTYQRLRRLFDIEFVLVTYEVDGEVMLRFTDWMARQRNDGVNLLEDLLAAEPNYWAPVTAEPNFGGERVDRSSIYRADGLPDPQRVSGYLFSADLSARLFEPGPATCLSDDSRGCFETAGTWTYTSSADTAQIVLTGDFALFDRDLTWELLDYDVEADVGTVLEFEFSLFDDGMGGEGRQVRVPPRLNRIDLQTLDDYPAELQDARNVGFLED